MKHLALAALLAAGHAAAESPADFRSTAPITVSAPDALQRVTLPFEAYRDGRGDFADLRVFNGRGEALPIAFAGAVEATRETPPSIALQLFPVAGAQSAAGIPGDLDVMVRSNADGTIVSVQGRRPGVAAPRPVAWLLDASQVTKPMRALIVEWDAGPGTEIAKVSVEASDDLKSWRLIASRAPIVRLEQGGQKLSQPRVELGAQRAKYLRVTAEPAAFAMRAVQVELEEVVKPPPRSTLMVAATAGTKPGEYLFDLGARLPVEALRVVLPTPNSVAPFAVAAREADSGPWHGVTSATFYRLVRDGAEIQSPAVAIWPRAARHWSIQLDPRSPGIGAAAPSLEVAWRPAQIVFVARGEGPYQLAFGNPEAKRAVLAVSELIPGYQPRAELKLPESSVGAVRSNAGGDGAWRQVMGDASPRKALLWAILVAAVLVMGAMAWRLKRQMRAPHEGEPRE